LVNCHKF